MEIIIDDKFKETLNRVKDDRIKKTAYAFLAYAESCDNVSELPKPVKHYSDGIMGARLTTFYRLLFSILGNKMLVLDLLDKRKG